MSDSPLPLARVIQNLRSELLRAVDEGDGKAIRFRLKPIELQLQIGIVEDASIDGGVKFLVVNFGAKLDHQKSTTHTLKLTLEPIDPQFENIVISDERTL